VTDPSTLYFAKDLYVKWKPDSKTQQPLIAARKDNQPFTAAFQEVLHQLAEVDASDNAFNRQTTIANLSEAGKLSRVK